MQFWLTIHTFWYLKKVACIARYLLHFTAEVSYRSHIFKNKDEMIQFLYFKQIVFEAPGTFLLWITMKLTKTLLSNCLQQNYGCLNTDKLKSLNFHFYKLAERLFCWKWDTNHKETLRQSLLKYFRWPTYKTKRYLCVWQVTLMKSWFRAIER